MLAVDDLDDVRATIHAQPEVKGCHVLEVYDVMPRRPIEVSGAAESGGLL